VGKRLVDFLGERIRGITNSSKAQDTRTSVTVNVSQFHSADGGENEAYQEMIINITTWPVLFLKPFLFIVSRHQKLTSDSDSCWGKLKKTVILRLNLLVPLLGLTEITDIFLLYELFLRMWRVFDLRVS
jgi:hypothetical protein